MRISDWSSDVCSSDLMHVLTKELRQVDVHGGFTAAAGHALYTARAFPQEYWNRVAFISEPTGRLVHRHILEQVGAGFKEKGDGWNMVASSDNWFGPEIGRASCRERVCQYV